MQTLGVTLDDVNKALTDAITKKAEITDFQKAIASGDVTIKELFPTGSAAWDKLIEFIASDDFCAEQPPQKNEENCEETHAVAPLRRSAEITYSRTSNGSMYAKYNGKILGLVLSLSLGGDFVLALYDHGHKIEIQQAKEEAANVSAPTGKRWIVPTDTHFNAIRRYGVEKVNNALKELHGDLIRQQAYLSATSQANRPENWVVRFILPL